MSVPLPGRILPLAPGTFRALRHRDFRLYWTGQFVSLTGTWMQSLAQGWLVLRLSNSPFQLGLVGFCAYAPVVLFTLFGGLAADRVSRRRALVVTQTLSLLQALTFALLTWTGTIQVWHVAVLAFLLGTVNSFDIPIRQSFLHELTGRDDLPNAIALNSAAFNAARLVGPAIAGVVLAEAGEAVCFLLNAASYLAVLVALLLIRSSRRELDGAEGDWLRGIRDGVRYAWRVARIRRILVMVAVSSLFGMPYSILMPALARDVLHGDQRTLGFLMGAAGAGAVLGALLVAGRRSTRHAQGIANLAMGAFGTSLVALSWSRSVGLSLPVLVITGGAMIVQMATSNAFLQLAAPAELRGRVVSLYTLMFLGTAPFGSLLSGFAARHVGTPAAVGIGGLACVAVALALAARSALVSMPGRRSVGDAPDDVAPSAGGGESA